MRASRGLLLLHGVEQVQAALEFVRDDLEVEGDLELLDGPGGLELVDVEHRGPVLRQRVERPLLDVADERATDVAPERVPVGPVLLGVVNEHTLGVLHDQLRGLEPDRALTDRLDLQERVARLPLRVPGAFDVDVSVTVTGDAVLRETDRDLAVLKVVPRRPTLRARLGGHREPRLRLRGPVPVRARQAPEPPPEHAYVPDPRLPLVVVAVPLGEDDLKLEGVLILRNLPPAEPVVHRALAEVRPRQFARVDDVVASPSAELPLREQVSLDRSEQDVLTLERVQQFLQRRAHSYLRIRRRPRSLRMRRRFRRI